MSLPNKLSVLRILLVPGVVASLVYYHPSRDWLRWVAFALFAAGMVSDALDGMLARARREHSELGALLDPIADKLLILATLISCAAIEGLPASMRVPAWFNLIVISRDVILVTGVLLLFAIQGRWRVAPTRLGKWTTGVQMLVIPTVLLGLPVKTPLIAAASVLTVCSGISYVRLGLRMLD
ncbi:MAG TPA: CDP-alcohol phosphatidyltransferase family protein [bacterium]